MPAPWGNVWISRIPILWGGVRTLGNSRKSLGSWCFTWLFERRVIVNFIMETKFQFKCHLLRDSDPPTVAGLQLAGCCSAVTLLFRFVERQCFCTFPLVYFNFSSILLQLQLSLVDFSLNMGISCPFFVFPLWGLVFPRRPHFSSVLPLYLFHVKKQGCFAASAPLCVPVQSVVRICSPLSDVSQTL